MTLPGFLGAMRACFLSTFRWVSISHLPVKGLSVKGKKGGQFKEIRRWCGRAAEPAANKDPDAMKLASYRWNDETHCGVFSDGRLCRLGSRIAEFLRGAQPPKLPDLGSLPSAALEEVQLLAPVPDPEKIICIGLNYREHAREAGLAQAAHRSG